MGRLCLGLAGPTASGKSDLAIRLAEYFNLEIISVDSVMVYHGLDIGSAKPDKSIRARIPHHLIDICQPHETYSAGRFCKEASLVLRPLEAQKKMFLMTGGTLLYFKAFQQGLATLPEKNTEIRQRIDAKAQAHGWEALHETLKSIDPLTAQRLHPKDQQRIQRALEIYEITGKSLSQLLKEKSKKINQKKQNFLTFVLMPSDREALRKKIYQRFSHMLEQGLIAEVEQVLAAYAHPGTAALPALRSVGYRQVADYIKAGDTQLSARAQMIEKAIFATCQLAKRQMTWIKNPRHWAGEVIYLDSTRFSPQGLFKQMTEAISQRLGGKIF